MVDDPIDILDMMTLRVIDMLKRDDELVKVNWYESEELVPFDKETNELSKICGSVELDDEEAGDIEHSGQTERNYNIECRVIVYVPPKLRTAETPTLNQFRQRIKTVFEDAEDNFDFPAPITGYSYGKKFGGSYKRELSVPSGQMIKLIAKTIIYEALLDYSVDKF